MEQQAIETMADPEDIPGMPEPQEGKRRTGDRVVSLSNKTLFAIIFLISIVISGLSIATYDFFIAQKVVTVNMQKYLEEQRQLYAAGKLTAEDVTKNLDGLIYAMKNAPKNRIIILEDVVANSSEKFQPK